MARDDRVSIPGPFGGIVRYNEEYKSRFQLTPTQVIIFAALVLVFVIALKLLWPVSA